MSECDITVPDHKEEEHDSEHQRNYYTRHPAHPSELEPVEYNNKTYILLLQLYI